jgi:prolyl oligopeptidase
METLNVVDDQVAQTKFTNAQWLGDEGFFYSTYDTPDGSHLSAKTDAHKVYFHTLGQTQSDDALVFGQPDDGKYRYATAQTSDDQRWLYVYGANDTKTNRVWVRSLAEMDAPFSEVTLSGDSRTWCVATTNSHHILYTDDQAANGRLVSVPVSEPSMQVMTDFIPESDVAIQETTLAAGHLFVSVAKDVLTVVRQYRLDGTFVRELNLPANGAVMVAFDSSDSETVFISCVGLSQPMVHIEMNVNSGEYKTRIAPTLPFDASEFVTEQVFYPSKDGTQIPMFISHKKGLKLDGAAPTMLYGYGGFNVTVPPVISATVAAWLEQGGVWVQANIRGGGEYGKRWHLAGTKQNRQNVFDDFIAAAEYLIDRNICSSNTLAIKGGSNGGLLVGACMTQRPELFAAALPAVGVLDMLRYHCFTSGAGWAFDYGTSEESEDMFLALKAYSPLHNVKDDQRYPWTLITTGDHDDRVVPAHSFKYAATLQQKASHETPQLIRIDKKAGHGAGKSKQAIIDETADQFAFAWMAFEAQS